MNMRRIRVRCGKCIGHIEMSVTTGLGRTCEGSREEQHKQSCSSMNGFERHGITRLSPSTLNHFAAAPAHWVMARLLHLRAPTSARAARGTAVEGGVHQGLIRPDMPIADCVAVAEAAFDRAMALTPDDRREIERANLAGYVINALTELRSYGVPSAAQHRVEMGLDDVPVPIEGYADWVFDDYGLIVDLKTTERLPASISDAHGRQGAVYAKAHGNYGMRFAYLKPIAGEKNGRAAVVYEMSAEDVRRHLTALHQIALRLGRFLSLSSDARELAGLLVPDFEHFWWNHPIARSHGRNVYGF
jgi:hypothetical protein